MTSRSDRFNPFIDQLRSVTSITPKARGVNWGRIANAAYGLRTGSDSSSSYRPEGSSSSSSNMFRNLPMGPVTSTNINVHYPRRISNITRRLSLFRNSSNIPQLPTSGKFSVHPDDLEPGKRYVIYPKNVRQNQHHYSIYREFGPSIGAIATFVSAKMIRELSVTEPMFTFKNDKPLIPEDSILPEHKKYLGKGLLIHRNTLVRDYNIYPIELHRAALGIEQIFKPEKVAKAKSTRKSKSKAKS
jgi:hypothetical protein